MLRLMACLSGCLFAGSSKAAQRQLRGSSEATQRQLRGNSETTQRQLRGNSEATQRHFDWCVWLIFGLALQHVLKCFRTCWYSPWRSAWYHPKTTPRSPQDHAKTAHWKSIDFWSKCWFGADVGHGHFYRESLRENDNPMKQETHKCRFFIKMLIWPWQWRWALLQRILVREWQSYETRDAQM